MIWIIFGLRLGFDISTPYVLLRSSRAFFSLQFPIGYVIHKQVCPLITDIRYGIKVVDVKIQRRDLYEKVA